MKVSSIFAVIFLFLATYRLAGGADILFYDTFNRSDNYNIDAVSTGMSGSLSPLAYTESFEANGTGSIRIAGSWLQMDTSGNMSSMYLEHNFTDASIVSAGGFTVKLDIVLISGGNDTSDCFGGFGIGLSQAQAAAAGDWNSPTVLRPSVNGSSNQAVCDFYVDVALDGYVRAWSGNNLVGATYVGATSGQLWVDFLTPGFASGQPFIARMYFNGREIAVSRLTWNQSSQNYIGVSARAGTYVKLDNLTITPFEDIITDKLDVTGDAVMNMADLTAVADQWLYGYNPPYPSADLNDDFNVNLKDLSVMSRHWPSWGSYSNPVIDLGKNIADPSVIFYNGTYYLYPTGDATNGYRVYTSTNLVNWTRGTQVFTSGRQHNWAPDVWRDPVSGKFYLYYTITSTINSPQKVVGVAEATSPLGQFSNMKDLFENAIDAHMFRDDNGSLYLYYVQFPNFNISVTRMSDPRTPTGSPTVLIYPQSSWETIGPTPVTEGPWIIKRNGIYYMLYSGSHTGYPNYAVGYATATSPMGPFTRAIHNPIVMRSEDVYGPGHGCAIQDAAGDWWHVHHQKRYITDNNSNRYICLDRLWFDQVGNLYGTATRGSYQLAPTEQ